MRTVRFGLIVIAALVLAFVSLGRVGAQSTLSQGPANPGTATDDNSAGGNAWSNTSNALVLDGSLATSLIIVGSPSTDLLALTNFGLTVPAGSTIVGVTVNVTLDVTPTNCAADNIVRLCTGVGAMTGSNQARPNTTGWQTSLNTVTYGSSSSTWGATLTPAIVNSAGFGFEIQAAGMSGCNSTITPAVDGATMTITYTPPPPAGTRRIFIMTQTGRPSSAGVDAVRSRMGL
ncbi:MAG: hypothetical protein ACREDR_00910 [Blastocatellia bacterium]